MACGGARAPGLKQTRRVGTVFDHSQAGACCGNHTSARPRRPVRPPYRVKGQRQPETSGPGGTRQKQRQSPAHPAADGSRAQAAASGPAPLREAQRRSARCATPGQRELRRLLSTRAQSVASSSTDIRGPPGARAGVERGADADAGAGAGAGAAALAGVALKSCKQRVARAVVAACHRPLRAALPPGRMTGPKRGELSKGMVARVASGAESRPPCGAGELSVR